MKKPSANDLAFNPSSVLRMINPFLQRSQSLGAADDDSREAGETACVWTCPSLTSRSGIRGSSRSRSAKPRKRIHVDVQDQLRHVQRGYPFRYLRFHGIFDEEMMVYDEDEAGGPGFISGSWTSCSASRINCSTSCCPKASSPSWNWASCLPCWRADPGK
ncbi:hypothetical protein QJQ58_10870 [Paenibacillus dendritiformis]|uniref:hypothetical protein n=1 Tax=Paenibacillus dendritiformis TaxID=130049 RepID=UPI00248B4F87|nr:hypothetical protein [Paenibacillus dendritiformis]WGU96705.1 hypothetical protein QJQ58_10870 [Paenibacillus dendritiformis]